MAYFYVENSSLGVSVFFVPLSIYYEMLHNDNIRYAGRCKNHEANQPRWNASNTCATLSPFRVANTLVNTQKATASTHIDNNMRAHTHTHNNSCKQPYGYFSVHSIVAVPRQLSRMAFRIHSTRKKNARAHTHKEEWRVKCEPHSQKMRC